MKAWLVIRHEIYVTWRRRAYLLMTFGVPLVAAIAVVLWVTLRKEEPGPQNPLEKLPDRPLGYVDHSGLFEEADEFAGILIPFPDEDSAIAALKAGRISSLYVISANYMATGEVTRMATQLDLNNRETPFFQAFLLSRLLGDADPRLFIRLVTQSNIVEHHLDETGVELGQIDQRQQYGSNFVLVYGFVIILLMATLIPSGYLLRSVVGEKENRTIEIVLSSVRPLELLTGKVLGQGAMALLQVLVWLGTGWALLNLAAGHIAEFSNVHLTATQLLIAVLYFVGGFLLVATIQAGIGAISTNMREGPQYAALVNLPILIPLWLMTVFIESPNGQLALILSLVPLTSPLSMIQRIAIIAVPWWQIVLSLILLALGVALTLWLAARIFRVHTLLSGTVPRPRELLKLLREA